MPVRVVIDGNIGVGKSTVLKALSAKWSSMAVVFEPVDEWVAQGFLDKMYKNEISLYEFQHMAMVSMAAAEAAAAPEAEVVVTERSLESSFEVFGKAVLDPSSESFKILQFSYEKLRHAFPWRSFDATHHIFLDIPPTEAFQRVLMRHRDAEAKTTLEYLETVEAAYKEWLARQQNVTVIDANRPVEEVVNDVWSVIQQAPLLKKALTAGITGSM
tara:strand:- start:501 stop:1145 length:645 start_codon:yes stop_codon:yes gene_type:complete